MKQGHIRMIDTKHLAITAILLAALPAFHSCEYDNYNADSQADGGMAVELSIRTRAISSTTQTYERGSTWENYIDIAGGDYKIYFFTNDKTDATDTEKNTLIAEFVPTEMTAVEESYYTQYTLSGKVVDDIAAYSDFKVVVLANWGTYPSVTAGTTTIDALVEGDNTTFSAYSFLTTEGVSSAHLIPFYGVHEYSNVTWRKDVRTPLKGEITLLRALAKVEVVMTEDSDIDSFDSVSIVHYNTSGYCAPSGVYLQSDYDHNYIWAQDFADAIHLVGGSNNNLGLLTHTFNRQSGTDTDTWTIYLPEYDNTSTDYSYITVKTYQMPDDDPFIIYFGNYTDGTCTAYTAEGSADDRYDIFRNYLYRFYVTVRGNELLVEVDSWEEVFDNEYGFNTEI